jgi:voltage-gated potassium channel
MNTEIDERKKYMAITSAAITTVIIGTIVFHYIEGFSWVDSLYFVVVTVTTVGYGDITPTTDLGKIATIILIISGLSVVGAFIQVYSKYRLEKRYKRKEK